MYGLNALREFVHGDGRLGGRIGLVLVALVVTLSGCSSNNPRASSPEPSVIRTTLLNDSDFSRAWTSEPLVEPHASDEQSLLFHCLNMKPVVPTDSAVSKAYRNGTDFVASRTVEFATDAETQTWMMQFSNSEFVQCKQSAMEQSQNDPYAGSKLLVSTEDAPNTVKTPHSLGVVIVYSQLSTGGSSALPSVASRITVEVEMAVGKFASTVEVANSQGGVNPDLLASKAGVVSRRLLDASGAT